MKLYNNKYKKLKKIGRGGYGVVYLVKEMFTNSNTNNNNNSNTDTDISKNNNNNNSLTFYDSDSDLEEELNNANIDNNNNNLYAMKKYYFDAIKRNKDLVNNQMNILKILNNKECYNNLNIKYIKENINCVPNINYCFTENNETFLIQNYYKYTLDNVIKKFKYDETNQDIVNFYKSIVYLLILSIAYFHENKIIHRDLKPDNIAISDEGDIVLLDYDLVHYISDKNEELSRAVGTISYKPCEILFGETKYNYTFDLWSVGCIISEIYLGKPLFNENNEFCLLTSITKTLGAPTEENYPGVTKLPNYIPFYNPKYEGDKEMFDQIFSNCKKDMYSLIKNLLNLNPSKRPMAYYIIKKIENYNICDNCKHNYITKTNKKECLSFCYISELNVDSAKSNIKMFLSNN